MAIGRSDHPAEAGAVSTGAARVQTLGRQIVEAGQTLLLPCYWTGLYGVDLAALEGSTCPPEPPRRTGTGW